MNGKSPYKWLKTGDEFYSALIAAINSAEKSVRLETYIFSAGKPGDDVRDALLAAVRRGVKTMVLIDSFGSIYLPAGYWNEFKAAGGEFRAFNPLDLDRIAFRDHRKLLVCDSSVAFIGGFNITWEEAGDGVSRGWCDLGLRLTGSIADELAASFDEMFKMAEFKIRRLPRLRLPRLFGRRHEHLPPVTLLTSQPGGFVSPIKNALMDDLRIGRSIRIVSGYFLPTRRLRQILRRSSKDGNDVMIITAGKTDVPLARYAGRSLYERFLRADISVHEYMAQILHAKLIIVDDIVYVGSANLDNRSLNINYELLVRIVDPEVAGEARRIFDGYLPHCQEIDPDLWKKKRGFWEKLMERFAHFMLARFDTAISRRQLPKLR